MSKPSLWWPKRWKNVGGNMLRGRILKLQKPFLFHWAHFNSPLMKATFKGMVQQSGPRLIIFLNILHNLLAWHLRVLIHQGESPFFVVWSYPWFHCLNSTIHQPKSRASWGWDFQYIPRQGFGWPDEVRSLWKKSLRYIRYLHECQRIRVHLVAEPSLTDPHLTAEQQLRSKFSSAFGVMKYATLRPPFNSFLRSVDTEKSIEGTWLWASFNRKLRTKSLWHSMKTCFGF